MLGRILKFTDFYREDQIVNKFDLINNIPRVELIATISSLNHLIKGPLDLNFNNSFKNQLKLIETIFLTHLNSENRKYLVGFARRLKDIYVTENGSVTLFTRASCLYALNDIILCDTIINEHVPKYVFHLPDCENIFKFMLLNNSELLDYSRNYEDEMSSDALGEDFFKVFMFKEIPHNQYYFIQNPINLLNRATLLFNYLKGSYNDLLIEYLNDYRIESPEEYIAIISQFFLSPGAIQNLHCFKVPVNDEVTVARLDKLSVRGAGRPNAGVKKFEFLEIKKGPFYKYPGEENHIYLLMDNIFFLEKAYDLFYWDFFFDKLAAGLSRRKRERELKNWGGVVGRFFEDYIKSIFEYSFNEHKDIVLKCTDDLKVKNGDEFADFYIRRKRQIIVGQAKCSFLPQVDYKEVYNIEDYNNINQDEFFSRFGLYQLIDTTVTKFREYAREVDNRLPQNKVFIYPVLITNEPIISTGITSQVFDTKFRELLVAKGIDIDNQSYRINRLTVIHIGELERLQESLKDKDFRFDNLLQTYAENTNIELSRDPYSQFMDFDSLIRKKIKGKAIPKYILDKKEGILKLMINFLNLK
ncbi:hypothetical protein LRR18_12980 [Mangrovimonas sp. AS39]|uniref:hypothetical protein n=1 Tax=Mangrovimonas futianensis TaxID=2895523 RepID=UPI001E53A895|nr:hypothetical protein [Mangrovimonas futianensis]MCF1192502.1 hypothetical protein [Mangrovimonas futianensis]MCF1196168.1 hypothetical protein [Mangrovimonas futianensis]